ncbi:unnamed protein product [Cyprideis torosa]|uniref:Uncharacterized protein n=1 Tax=Cyprideis torosa TaxID=163714 RepID=A0A7R8WTK9_9CRUS|nr:unnamed protein product [Cyprideis torosa]CAG0905751.1 unnamed protein product [Cyprideis torosa]
MMGDQLFVYDASIVAPLGRVPIWPYTLYFRMPHLCPGNGKNCPSKSHPVWEMVVNELDRRDDPTFDENLPGCHFVDSCTNINTPEQFGRLLRHNVNRHLLYVIQWMQNPTETNAIRDFQEWKEKCDIKGQPYCSLPNACPVTTRELPGETLRLFTCVDCPKNYPWINDPTGNGLF